MQRGLLLGLLPLRTTTPMSRSKHPLSTLTSDLSDLRIVPEDCRPSLSSSVKQLVSPIKLH
eukprot:10948377-Karenia_brevis.AAC.1